MQKVTRDLFRIAQRLKHINPNYKLFWNSKFQRYEVRGGTGGNAPLEFVVPYKELDERTLEHARRTRKQNDFALEMEIARHNEGIEKSAMKSMEIEAERLADMLAFALRTGRDVAFTKNYIKEF